MSASLTSSLKQMNVFLLQFILDSRPEGVERIQRSDGRLSKLKLYEHTQRRRLGGERV
jgi:hypothetical protein